MKKKKKGSLHKLFLFIVIIGIIVFLQSKGYIQVDTYAALVNNVENEKDYTDIILVNKNNKIPDDYKVDLVEYDGHKVNSIMINDLKEMYKDAKNDGIKLKINTAYRDKSEQQDIYNRRIRTYEKEGMNENKAIEKTEEEVQKPGYSEHETGLAIDFSNPSNPEENEPMWKWLSENAYKYGFILRYPKDKETITMVSNEEWHYRYVGKEIAKQINSTGECLEEYVNKLL